MTRITCPKCGQSTEFGDPMAGRTVICPRCGNVTLVPGGTETVNSVHQVFVTPVIPRALTSNTLGITALVFAVFASLAAWIPVLGCVSIPFAILGLLLGVAGLIAQTKKILPLTATIIAGLALVLQLFWIFVFASAAGGRP